MQREFPIDPVSITLNDGNTYGLRYSFGAVKRIKAKFGKDLQSMLANHAVEDILLSVLQEGLTEKVSETKLEDELLTGPMTEYAFGRFVEAFFAPGERDFWMAADEARKAALAQIRAKTGEVMAQAVETTAASIKTVN